MDNLFRKQHRLDIIGKQNYTLQILTSSDSTTGNASASGVSFTCKVYKVYSNGSKDPFDDKYTVNVSYSRDTGWTSISNQSNSQFSLSVKSRGTDRGSSRTVTVSVTSGELTSNNIVITQEANVVEYEWVDHTEVDASGMSISDNTISFRLDVYVWYWGTYTSGEEGYVSGWLGSYAGSPGIDLNCTGGSAYVSDIVEATISTPTLVTLTYEKTSSNMTIEMNVSGTAMVVGEFVSDTIVIDV